jgi:osmotically-inducible protein OsmY
MKTSAPVMFIAAVSVLPFGVGCQTMGSTIKVQVPTAESLQDQVLSKSVRDRLLKDKRSDLTGIAVVSKSGTVYLTGVVNSLDARQQAIKIAWDVPGVQSVVNSLDVQK